MLLDHYKIHHSYLVFQLIHRYCHFFLEKFQMFFLLRYQHQEKLLVVVEIIVFALLAEELGFFGVIEIVLFFP